MRFNKYILILSIFFTSCIFTDYIEKTGISMGSIASIRLYDDKSYFLLNRSFKIIDDINKDISLTSKNSYISKINNNPTEWTPVSKNCYELIKLSSIYAKQSDEKFNPILGKLTQLWNFDGDAEPSIPKNETILEYLAYNDYRNILFNNPNLSVKLSTSKTAFDLGGIGKGYACDKVAQYLKIKKVKSALINLGGNIQTIGTKPDGSLWKISIQEPFKPIGQSIGILSIGEGAIVTSGNYQKYFEYNGKNYHHILNNKTGYPVENNLYAVTIISSSGAYADALSTAVFAMGLDTGMTFVNQTSNIKAIFITSDKKIYFTDGLEKNFELTSTDYKIASYIIKQ